MKLSYQCLYCQGVSKAHHQINSIEDKAKRAKYCKFKVSNEHSHLIKNFEPKMISAVSNKKIP